MKIDVYTKVILTGIFACLCLIVLRDVRLESRAEAQGLGGTQDVRVVGWRAGELDVDVEEWNAGDVDVKIVGIDKYVFKHMKSHLPVKVESPLPVKVEEWGAGNLRVDVDEFPVLP